MMMMLQGLPLLLLVSLVAAVASAACTVNNMTASEFAENRKDVTYIESENKLICAQRTYASCYHADIQGCSIVECRGQSSCSKARIQGSSGTLVNCTMKNACLQSKILIQGSDSDNYGDETSSSSVHCQGDYSCYLSNITIDSSEAATVTCDGYRACYSSDSHMVLNLENAASSSRAQQLRRRQDEESSSGSKVKCLSDRACENVKITASCLECSTDMACHYLCDYKASSSTTSWSACASSISEDCGSSSDDDNKNRRG